MEMIPISEHLWMQQLEHKIRTRLEVVSGGTGMFQGTQSWESEGEAAPPLGTEVEQGRH